MSQNKDPRSAASRRALDSGGGFSRKALGQAAIYSDPRRKPGRGKNILNEWIKNNYPKN